MKNLAFLFIVLTTGKLYAQGCSDAGFCSIGNLAHPQPVRLTKSVLKLSLPVGEGDDGVIVFAPGLEYLYHVKQWQWQAKVTANYASGNLGKAFAAGDVFLAATYSSKHKPWTSSATLGVKLPLNQGNLKEDGRSLPMQYQSSLGTVDVIAGAGIQNKRWQFAAGWQQPLTGINRNNFLPEYWPTKQALEYPPGNDFKRRADALFRTTYKIKSQQKVDWSAGLLAIYHIGEDTYVNVNESPGPIAIKGSKGITLNITSSVDFEVGRNWRLGIVAGAPLVVRDVRPDGLTRSFVIAPSIAIKF